MKHILILRISFILSLTLGAVLISTINIAHASQVSYNPNTGSYEERESTANVVRKSERQRLFTNMKSGIQKITSSSPFLPSFSLYGGFSGYQTTSQSSQYQDPTQKPATQTIPAQTLLNGNMMLGLEFMLPITQNMSLGIGVRDNFESSIFNQTVSSQSRQPFDVRLKSTVYGKIAYKISRVSLYFIGGVQPSIISLYDSEIKDDTSNPWTSFSPKSRASYAQIGSAFGYTTNEFFGLGIAYKLSPSTSVFVDANYLVVKGWNLNGLEHNSHANQINALLKDKQYEIVQTRVGLSFDFIGFAFNSI